MRAALLLARVFAADDCLGAPVPVYSPDGSDPLDDRDLLALAGHLPVPDCAFLTVGSRPEVRFLTAESEVAFSTRSLLAAAAALARQTGATGPLTLYDRTGEPHEVSVAAGLFGFTSSRRGLQPVPDELRRRTLAAARCPAEPFAVLAGGKDLIVVLPSADLVRDAAVDLAAVRALPTRGVALTAPAGEGAEDHYVCRYFSPQSLIDEDTATASLHVSLAELWSAETGLSRLRGRQVGPMGARALSTVRDTDVLVAGEVPVTISGHVGLPALP
jgi:predicted PhzF superfamily epimerase YddE/YHI9